MAGARLSPLTERQLEVMKVVWADGSATVHEVRETLDLEEPYTSTLSILQTLEERGLLKAHPDHLDQRRHRYAPTTSQKELRKAAMSRMVELWYGWDRQTLEQDLYELMNPEL